MKIYNFSIYFLILFAMSLIACNQNQPDSKEDKTASTVPPSEANKPGDLKPVTDSTKRKTYSNERFRNVSLLKLDADTYVIRGQGQLFEGTLNWVIEDGLTEMQSGHATADKGGPEWGSFSFAVKAKPMIETNTIHIILFEINAENGQRRYELPIPLK